MCMLFLKNNNNYSVYDVFCNRDLECFSHSSSSWNAKRSWSVMKNGSVHCLHCTVVNTICRIIGVTQKSQMKLLSLLSLFRHISWLGFWILFPLNLIPLVVWIPLVLNAFRYKRNFFCRFNYRIELKRNLYNTGFYIVTFQCFMFLDRVLWISPLVVLWATAKAFFTALLPFILHLQNSY